ncbi:anion transporter [Salegentibacter salinarum]|uniref:Anion transporter n=1 Tax=Salegentibacter salinarum TaxID=447422 RepID=A0A2N0TS66_9FLAO|nr:SLC13 family permease [Salegentibacter salinarum]PKD17581.1 anion transporter [Salegentibacter salinarum]SKB49085.1 solute carrier family 13 (sodium-dependent dicarboxylate transporter), member 2/3/5 [Salegentibacter salinarum]
MNKLIRTLILIAGPLLFLILQIIGAPQSMPPAAFDIFCITIWMALWWVTEVIPISVTALIPIVMFPLTGALDIETTTAAFGHKYVFLYLGGFVLAVAIEKWDLHRRIALNIINLIGSKIKFIILGFMIATAFLSMWISNTATSVMMLPIGTAIISQLKNNPFSNENEPAVFGKALMLAIAYSASIGGIATLIGTPPNLVFAGIVEELYGIEISFLKWAFLGIPISILLIFICWKYLTVVAFNFDKAEFPGGKAEITTLLKSLGKISKQEKRVLIIFACTAFFWITRSFLIQPFLPFIDDTIIAIIAAIALFIVPSGKETKPLLNWEEAVKIPWGIILLFGGGMALAKGFSDTGLAVWIGEQLTYLQNLPLFLLILILVAAVNFLTEVTSNLATTAMLLPILAPMALAMGLHPYLLLISATLAASCAFMLPVATPPNAVVFGSGYLKIPDMIKTGLWMNLVSILLISVLVYFFLPVIWDFKVNEIPQIFR